MHDSTTNFLRLAAALTVAVTSSAASLGQHFSRPAPVDPREAEAIAAPVFSVARATTSFGAVADDGWLYVMGGYTGRAHDYYHEGQSRDFYRVNLHDHSIVQSLPDTRGLQACPLESHDGRIIVTGGMVALNSRGEEQQLLSIDAVRSYDPHTRAWTELPSLPGGRSSHETAVINGHLYVVGGWTLDPARAERVWADDVLVLDLDDTAAGWQSVQAPFERRALGVAAVGNHLVVIGGLTSDREMSSGVDVLDTTTGQWSTGPEFPGASFGVAAVTVGTSVVASGSDGVMYSWNPDSDASWHPVASLTFPRFFHQLAADYRGDVYVIGGTSRGVRPIHVERVSLGTAGQLGTPTEDRAADVIAHWTIPTPGSSKNRQGIFVEDGWLYMFGGNNSTGQHDFEPHNFLTEGYRLSLSGFRWQPVDSLPSPRQSLDMAMSPDGANALAIGGFAHDGEIARTFANGFMYNMRERSWRELGSVLPTPRSQFDLVQHGDQYYIFGGLDYDSRREEGDHFRHVTPVLVADAATDSPMFEESGIELTTPRRAFGGATLDGQHYIVGGMRENFTVVERSEVFDFATRTFRDIASPQRPRLSPSMIALGGRIFLAGGSSPRSTGQGFEPNPTIEAYDPATDSWSTVLEEIPITPRHMRMMEFRGRLLLVSTHTDEADVIHLVLIDPGR